MYKLVLLLIPISIVLSCKSTKDTYSIYPKESKIHRIYEAMVGEFSSQKQAKEDKNYDHVDFYVRPIQIEGKEKAYWMYAEQINRSDAIALPYRYIYKLAPSDDMVRMVRYQLPMDLVPELTAEKYHKLNGLSEDRFKKLAGCTVYFVETDTGDFQGTTLGRTCINRFKGAQFSRLDMRLGKDRFIFLEQGFDEYDKHIWGPKKRGLTFLRK